MGFSTAGFRMEGNVKSRKNAVSSKEKGELTKTLKSLTGKLTGKKGGVMVEAAMVLPIVIVAVITLVYLLINMYGVAVMNSAGHIELRQESGVQKENSSLENIDALCPEDRYGSAAWNESIEVDKGGFLTERYLYLEREKSLSGRGLINHVVNKSFYASYYMTDEVEYIRWVDLIKKARQQSS